MEKPTPPTPPPKPKRTRAGIARQSLLHYESLPTAPPILCGRQDENIFQFPTVPARQRNQSASPNSARRDQQSPYPYAQFSDAEEPVTGKHYCRPCQDYQKKHAETREPWKMRLNSAIEAMDELNRTYALLESFLEQKLATKIVEEEADNNILSETERSEVAMQPLLLTSQANTSKPISSDIEFELERSLTLVESLMGTEIVPEQTIKQGKFKRIRERSKSMMEDEITLHNLHKDRSLKNISSRPYLLRRQSTYSDSKSKVSKWTKVKAAFKWERANVPPPSNEPGALHSLTTEMEKYLKVPMNATGGSSSADSIISSSSGHFLSDTGGTPGTISSASSADDLEASCRHAARRDTLNYELGALQQPRLSPSEECLDGNRPAPTMPSKSSSNKSLRRSKAFSDFEVLPEDHVADIKSTSSRRAKPPLSPLNLNKVSSDLPQLYSPLMKSPKDGSTSTLPRMRRVNSPGNSSVPSSPSRHSDFFGEFESEDLSSGDFSEPTTPNRKTFQQKEEEVIQRYQLLLIKLDMEFKHKQREFERSGATSRNATMRASGKKSSEEYSPTQILHSDLMSTAQLEENLTPEFKKKLHKWRAKQQTSGTYASSEPATSPTVKSQSGEIKQKIDWNLWSTGQMKLEGQGLCALPEQKDLPEKFQKKLEQWNKLKSTGGGATSDNDSLKRGSKHSQSTRRGSDDDRWYKHKPHEKEKLSRLKAIVAADHPSKNIEVKTSDGEVMKFEGISRKFTRKLYEWEKARGIGPEASTFALLHPGYCPIDVRRINKESKQAAAEHSPTLSRSLSLDSVAPNVVQPMISQQASSLSLNDMNELKDVEDSADALTDHEYKKYDEPEAVMVEVEEHIHDTASPLVTAHTLVEQQTPIYKYEEVQCNDYCNSRRVQSFESHTNLAPLLGALKRAEEMFAYFKQISPDILEHVAMRDCQATLLNIRSIYPYYSNNLMKPTVLNAISDVQSELGRLTELSHKSPLDEACCQETMEERTQEYVEELHGLLESLECLKLSIQGGNRYPRDLVPDINITNEDGLESAAYSISNTASRPPIPPPIVETDEQSVMSPIEQETETSTVQRGSASTAVSNGAKKKLRLRKMGSRQNSKTESDSSDADTHSVLETPRRLRRKNFRIKQRSLDDDFRLRADEPSQNSNTQTQDDVLFTSLKVKPGEPIQQSQSIGSAPKLSFVPPPLPEQHNLNYANVFVKTKRKLFTTIAEPNAAEGIAIIEKELESPQSNEEKLPTAPSPQIERPRPSSTSHVRPPLYKSISLERLTPKTVQICELLPRCQSSESALRKSLVRQPLARDSISTIPKSLSLSKRGQLMKSVSSTIHTPNAPPRKEHLYKKHSLYKSQSATVGNKLENKIAKTSSGPAVLPNKMDNTQPRIQRKLEGKTLTPTKPKRFEFPTALELSKQLEKPTTPLSERAQRLQRARAEFLQSAPATPRQGLVATAATTPSDETTTLLKSISAGTITTDPNQDISTDQESLGHAAHYDSLPRSVSRSAKISSKLGFASLASKLRRVKSGGSGSSKKSKDSPTGSALSALCRQTLFADAIALPQAVLCSEPIASHNVHKSRSSPQAATRSELHTSHEGLNKSLSEQYVRQLKESDV